MDLSELVEVVYIAKNLKGIYLPGENVEEVRAELKKLMKMFRYRRVGVLPETFPGEIHPPLHPVNIPPPFLLPLPTPLDRLIPISSMLMLPVISSPSQRDLFGDLYTYSIRLSRPLTSQEFRFNLRLLIYIPLDLSVKESWDEEDVVKDCEKRFWRFRDEAGGGEVRLGVITPGRYVEDGASPAVVNPVGVIFLD